jgi:hypothetical protein
MQLAHRVPDLDMAIVDDEAPNGRQLEGFVGILPVLAVPVGTATFVTHQEQCRFVDPYQRQDDVTKDQRYQPHFDPCPLEAGRLGRTDPAGIANKDFAHIHAGLPAEQLDGQIAFDTHFPTAMAGKIAAERASHLVPIQEIERDDGCDQESQKRDSGPFEEPTPGEPEVTKIRHNPGAGHVPAGFHAVISRGLQNGHGKSIT